MWKIVKVNVGTTNQLECLGLTNSSSKGPEDGGGAASSTCSICRGSTWQRQCCLQVGKGICNSQRGLWYRSYAHQGARLFCTLHCALLIGPDNTKKRHTSAICLFFLKSSKHCSGVYNYFQTGKLSVRMLCYSHPINLDPALSLHWMLESMAHVDLVPRSWQQMFPDTCEEVQHTKGTKGIMRRCARFKIKLGFTYA